MKNVIFGALLIMALTSSSQKLSAATESGYKVYIVSVDEDANLKKVMKEMERMTGGKVVDVFENSLHGFSIKVPADTVQSSFFFHSDVMEVEPDIQFETQDFQAGVVGENSEPVFPEIQASQQLPPGINRVNADLSLTAKINGIDDPMPVNIAIIDTGIDSNNPDLNVVYSKNFAGSGSGQDDNGHGTHVAGIAAAKDNGLGIVGVAPGARLYALKVLNSSGSGSLSYVIKALDWVAGQSSTSSSSSSSSQKKYEKYMKKYNKYMEKYDKYIDKYNDYYYTRYNEYYARYVSSGRTKDLEKAQKYREKAPKYLDKAFSYQQRAEEYKRQAEQYVEKPASGGVKNPNKIDVVNMSLGAQGVSSSLQKAIKACVDRGVVVVVSAGNNYSDIFGPNLSIFNSDDFIPAAYPEVVTVSAMTDTDGRSGGAGPLGPWNSLDDTFIGFSNNSRGTPTGNPVTSPGRGIDVGAPGVNIYSTWLSNGFAYRSGTSMAAPHVAGAFALLILKLGQDVNQDGKIDGTDVTLLRKIVIETAEPQKSWRGGFTMDPDPYLEGLIQVQSF